MAPRALIVWGGWEGHQPEQQARVAASVLEANGFTVELREGFAALADSALMEAIDLVVPVCTSISFSPAEQEGLAGAVERGAGLAAWHGAATAQDSPLYSMLLGGQFVAHPGGMVDYRVHVLQPAHPVTHGVEGFDITSEQYVLHVDPSNVVLAVTMMTAALPPMEGREMPVIWTRSWGRGRVFYSALGHTPEELQIPAVRRVLEQGMLWAARRS